MGEADVWKRKWHQSAFDPILIMQRSIIVKIKQDLVFLQQKNEQEMCASQYTPFDLMTPK